MIFNKATKHREKTISPINGAGKSGYPHVKE